MLYAATAIKQKDGHRPARPNIQGDDNDDYFNHEVTPSSFYAAQPATQLVKTAFT